MDQYSSALDPQSLHVVGIPGYIDPNMMEGHFSALLTPHQFEPWLAREASYRNSETFYCAGRVNTPIHRFLTACNKWNYIAVIMYDDAESYDKWGLLIKQENRHPSMWITVLRAELPDWAKDYQAALRKFNVFDPAVNQTQIRPEHALAIWYGSRGDDTHYANPR